jgi:ubiquinone/menaquinone biosynthesis C-methylase UbiE
VTPKVVYIAGPHRSGSTVLEQALGEIEGWVSCGEINLLWWNQECSCGTPIFACDFWQPIIEGVLARHPEFDPPSLISLQAEELSASPRTLAAISRAGRRDGPSALRSYASLIADLYASAARSADARVLIDSSKTAADAYLLATLTDIELYVVHLVRDPRGVAYSWSKSKVKGYAPLQYFGRMSPLKSSFHWLRRNAVIETALRKRQRDRYFRVRYEDFVERPEQTVRSICSLVGEPDVALPFTGSHTVRTRPNHMASGNPVRFSTGERRISADEEWRRRMDPRARMVATLAAAPMMRRYGYRLGGARLPRTPGEAKEGIAAFWDAKAADYDSTYNDSGSNGYVLRSRLETALTLLGDGPGNVLDAGMGPGRAIVELDGRNWTVSGIDASEQMVALSRSRLPAASGRLLQARIESIPFEAESFDAVLVTGVLEYIDFRPEVIDELARVLRPGGRAVLSLPNRRNPSTIWRRSLLYPLTGGVRRILGLGRSSIPRPRPPSRARFRRILSEAGFAVETEAKIFTSSRFRAGGWGSEILAAQFVFAARKQSGQAGLEPEGEQAVAGPPEAAEASAAERTAVSGAPDRRSGRAIGAGGRDSSASDHLWRAGSSPGETASASLRTRGPAPAHAVC